MFPLTLTVAIFVLFETTLNVPVFPLTVNVVLVGYVNVPLVADNVNVPAALFTLTVSVFICVLYPALLAFTVTVNDDVSVIVGIVVLYVPPFIEYSNLASLGVTFTLVKALCTFPSYVPVYGVALKLIVPFWTVASYVADFSL